jgi:hypothetical protein
MRPRMSCRLFDGDDSETIGIVRCLPDSLEGNHTLAQQKTGSNWNCPDASAGNPLVAGSSPARPTK